MGYTVGILSIPSDLINIIAASVAVAVAIVASSCSELPLGLTGQAECPACHLVKFSDKLLSIVPCHLLDRVVGAARLAAAIEIARIAAHHGLPQGLRHFGLSDGKWR